jgi:hypothetical protein
VDIYERFAPQYAELGLVSIPVDRKKRSRVKGWKKLGVESYQKLLITHADANIALLDGTRGGLTRVDIDDAKLLDECLERFGETPVITKTPSGGFHLFYRSNGEQRMLGVEDKKIDILGSGGYGLVPGSMTDAGIYQFIEGSLIDLGGNLPHMKAAPQPRSGVPEQMRAGDGRNTFLFHSLRNEAQQCKDEAELVALADTLNNNFAEPLPATEVRRIAGSVWRYVQKGRLWVKGCEPSTLITKSIYDELNVKELNLFLGLTFAHGAKNGRPFVLAQPAAKAFGMSIHSLRLAQAGLEAKGFIEVVKRGERKKPQATIVRLSSRQKVPTI